jgi:hypothetical protein
MTHLPGPPKQAAAMLACLQQPCSIPSIQLNIALQGTPAMRPIFGPPRLHLAHLRPTTHPTPTIGRGLAPLLMQPLILPNLVFLCLLMLAIRTQRWLEPLHPEVAVSPLGPRRQHTQTSIADRCRQMLKLGVGHLRAIRTQFLATRPADWVKSTREPVRRKKRKTTMKTMETTTETTICEPGAVRARDGLAGKLAVTDTKHLQFIHASNKFSFAFIIGFGFFCTVRALVEGKMGPVYYAHSDQRLIIYDISNTNLFWISTCRSRQGTSPNSIPTTAHVTFLHFALIPSEGFNYN